MSYIYKINEESYSDSTSVVLLDEILVTKTPFGKKFDISYSLFDRAIGYYSVVPTVSASVTTTVEYTSFWFDNSNVSNFLNTVIVLCFDESTYNNINETNYREPSKFKKIAVEPTKQKKQTNLKLSDFNLITQSNLSKFYSIPFKKTIDNIIFDDTDGFVGIYIINEFDLVSYKKQFNSSNLSTINSPFISFRPYSAIVFNKGNYLKTQTFNAKKDQPDKIWLIDEQIATDTTIAATTFPLSIRDLSVVEDFSVLENKYFKDTVDDVSVLNKQKKTNSYFSDFYSSEYTPDSQTTQFFVDFLNIIFNNSFVYNLFSDDYKKSNDILEDFKAQGSGIGSIVILAEPFYKDGSSAKSLNFAGIEVSSVKDKIIGSEEYINIPVGTFLVTLIDKNIKTYLKDREIYYKLKIDAYDPFAIETRNDLLYSTGYIQKLKSILNLFQNPKYYDFNKNVALADNLLKQYPNIDTDIKESIKYYIKLKKKFSNYSSSLDKVNFEKIYDLLIIENSTYKNLKSFTESFEKIYNFVVKKTNFFNRNYDIINIEYETDILVKSINKEFYISSLYENDGRKLLSNIFLLKDQSPDYAPWLVTGTNNIETFFNFIQLEEFKNFKKFYYESVSEKKISLTKVDIDGRIVDTTEIEKNDEIDSYFFKYLSNYLPYFEKIKKNNYKITKILNINSGVVDDRTNFIYKEIFGLENTSNNPALEIENILSDTILDNFLKAFKADPYFYQNIDKFIIFLAFFSSFYRFQYYAGVYSKSMILHGGQIKNLIWMPITKIPQTIFDLGVIKRTKIDLKEFLPRNNLHLIDIFGYSF